MATVEQEQKEFGWLDFFIKRGLNFFKVETSQNVEHGKYHASVVYSFDYKTVQDLKLELVSFANKIKSSKMVHKIIDEKYDQIRERDIEIEDLKATIERNEKKIAALKQFKINFDMNYYAKHGEMSQLHN